MKVGAGKLAADKSARSSRVSAAHPQLLGRPVAFACRPCRRNVRSILGRRSRGSFNRLKKDRNGRDTMRASPGRKCKRAAVACRAENNPCEDRFSGEDPLTLAPALLPILADHYHRYRAPRQLESVRLSIYFGKARSVPAACSSALGKRYGKRCGPLRLAERTRVGRSWGAVIPEKAVRSD
jgi:hypothetical protein